LEPYYARSAEMAVRAATIVACGIDADAPAVSVETMAWARDLMMHSARTMVAGVKGYVGETEPQRRAQEGERILGQSGGAILWRDLHRRLAHRHKRRDLEDPLLSMVESETIAIDAVAPPRGGRAVRTIRLL